MSTTNDPRTDALDPNSIPDDFEVFRPDGWKKPPTVMQVLPALSSGGVERGTVDMAKSLVAAGWKAIVVSSGGPMVHELERIGGVHIELPIHLKNPLAWRSNFDKLVDLIARHNVDLVHARSRMPAWIAWRASRVRNVPFVTTFHGRYPDSNPLKKIYNGIMVRGDRVIAISHYIGDEILRRFNLDPQRLRVIQRGIDMDVFDPDRVSAERMIKFTQEWRLADGVPVIMLPGRVTRWKGHETLIAALAELSDIDFRCLIVGPYEGKSGFKADLEAKISQLGLDAKVQFVGGCRDMPAAYKLSDVVVSPSLDPEPFGRVIVEAQAMGRPVVASDHGGAAETMIEGETGWLVRPRDPSSLAAGLRQALTMDGPARDRMAVAAVAHARENFSRVTMCARTLAVYMEVLPDEIGHRQ